MMKFKTSLKQLAVASLLASGIAAGMGWGSALADGTCYQFCRQGCADSGWKIGSPQYQLCLRMCQETAGCGAGG